MSYDFHSVNPKMVKILFYKGAPARNLYTISKVIRNCSAGFNLRPVVHMGYVSSHVELSCY